MFQAVRGPRSMYQKDYILFMIEQFGRLLQRLAKFLKDEQFDDASYEIEQVYRQYLGVNSDLIGSLAYETLMMMQSADRSLYHDKCIVLAELLRLEGEIFARHARTDGVRGDARDRYLKSLNIFLTILLESTNAKYAEYHDRPDRIVKALQDVHDGALPERTVQLLERFQKSGDAP